MNTPSILFVCMGNICRSPTAEIVWAKMVKEHNETHSDGTPDYDSAGTIAYHAGEPPDSRMQVALRNAGYNIFGTSRKINSDDFEKFDLILAMDRDNLRNIQSFAASSGKSSENCHLFLEYAGVGNGLEVPDPYYGGDSGFTHVVQLVEQGCEGLLSKLGN